MGGATKMSKQSQDALAAIDRIVFKSSKPIVVALTGGWGEGKTYFWKTQVIPSHPEVKPGYVSVFGAESLAAIRESVVISKARVSEVEGNKVFAWIRRARQAGATWARSAINFWGAKFLISDSIAVELLQTFALKPGWIVCIDDVERLSESVGFEKFLGYVSELRDEWRLKVVLIFNKEPIDDDPESAFHVYHEKVIDRVIPFALDFHDIVSLVFSDLKIDGFDVHGEAQNKSQILALRNIRILEKARSYFEEVVQELGSNVEGEFLRSALNSVLLFTYTKFSNQKPAGLTFSVLAVHSEWGDRFRKASETPKKGDGEEKKDEAKELLESYRYEATNDLDLVLMSFVQIDVLDGDRLREVHLQFQQETHRRELDHRLQEVWDIQYHGTLSDNSKTLCAAVEAALRPYLQYVPPLELDFALKILSNFGRAEIANQFFDEFKRIRGDDFERLAQDSMPHGEFLYGPLKKYLIGIADAGKTDTRPIEVVMTSAFSDRFISSVDSNRIAEFSVDELVRYFMEHDQPKLTSKIRVLTKDDNDVVRQMAYEAAEKIADMHPLNRMRMEGMGFVQAKPLPDNAAGS
jgi:hypothetical protein